MARRSSRALRKHFGNAIPETIIEPGRGMVGDAGVIKAEVVLISKKADDDKAAGSISTSASSAASPRRWTRRSATRSAPPMTATRTAPCVIAGPTCDSADVLYEKTPYALPLSLTIGDEVLIEGTGAYTTTYSAVAFNGFAPLQVLRDLTRQARVGSAVAGCRRPQAPEPGSA